MISYQNHRANLVRVARLVCVFFPEGRKQRCRCRPADSDQLSTGQLNLVLRVSHHTKQKAQTPHVRYLDFWSEWRDSNSRHPGPKPGALPTGPHPDIELKKNGGEICVQDFGPLELLGILDPWQPVLVEVMHSKLRYGGLYMISIKKSIRIFRIHENVFNPGTFNNVMSMF